MKEHIEKILFATDFTEEAENARGIALEIAQRFDAELVIFHSVQEVFDFATRSERIIEEEVETAKDKIQAQVAEIKKKDRFKGLTINYSVKVGRTVTNLDQEAVNQQADLLVMGYLHSDESSVLKKLLTENVTSDVIISSDVPVLAVPATATKSVFEYMVFASNYQQSDEQILNYTTDLAEEFNAEVAIIHVDEEMTDEHLKAFKAYKERINTSVTDYHFSFHHLSGEDFAETISAFLKESKADLMIMGRKKRNFLQYIFTMGEAKELAVCKDIPLLVMPPLD